MTRNEWSARKGRTSSWIRREKRLAIYLRDGFTCCYCGKDLHDASPRNVHLDHLRPRERGGTNDPSNLITACGRCNSARHDEPWRRWLQEWFGVAVSGHVIVYINRVRRRKLNLELAKSLIAGEELPCEP